MYFKAQKLYVPTKILTKVPRPEIQTRVKVFISDNLAKVVTTRCYSFQFIPFSLMILYFLQFLLRIV